MGYGRVVRWESDDGRVRSESEICMSDQNRGVRDNMIAHKGT